MEKETNTVALVVDHEGSELDSLAGVSSLKEELVRDVLLDPPHTSNLLIDVGGSPLQDLDQKKNPTTILQSKEAGTELCWWENSNPSDLDLPTTKILEASTSQVPSQNIFEEKKKEEMEDFEESVNKFQPSTSDLAALASPVLPTSSSSLSSIYALTQVRNNYIS